MPKYICCNCFDRIEPGTEVFDNELVFCSEVCADGEEYWTTDEPGSAG